MARRALDFAVAHALTDSGYLAVVARLKAAIAQADTLGMLQGSGQVHERSATSQRQDVRKAIASHQLRRLCRIGEVGAAGHPELTGLFTPPRAGGPNRTFVLMARTMLDDAIAHKDILTTLGIGDNFIAELTQAVAEFDALTEGAHASRADHVGASAQLRAIAHRCSTDVDVIDTYMRASFANDPQTLVAWQSAKNLAGPFVSKGPSTPPDASATGTSEPVK